MFLVEQSIACLPRLSVCAAVPVTPERESGINCLCISCHHHNLINHSSDKNNNP